MLVEEQVCENNGISQKACLLLVLLQPLCSREYSGYGIALCGLMWLLLSVSGVSQTCWESYEIRTQILNCLALWGWWCFTKAWRNKRSEVIVLEVSQRLSPWLPFLVGFESVEGGRSSGLWLNIFIFVLLAEINLGPVDLCTEMIYFFKIWLIFSVRPVLGLCSGTNSACWWAVSLSVYKKS